MKIANSYFSILLAVAAAGCGGSNAAPAMGSMTATTEMPQTMPQMAAAPTDDAMIKSAMAAAPMAVAQDATVMAMNEKMEMRTLRQGTNGWTCLPDMPTTPGNDPMCLDKNGAEWAMAWMHRQPPPKGKMGFGYMLMGGSDASNDDPFATAPKPGARWIDTGPHVMVLNIGTSFDGYPTSAANPAAPYVMFPNTPYAHLMLPVK